MKTHHAHHAAGIVCRVARVLVTSHAIKETKGEKRPGFLVRHATACPSCRHYFATSAELDQQLTRDARHEPATPSTDLEDRILQAIELPSAPRRRAVQHRRRFVGFGLAGAAAAIAFALVWYWSPTTEPQLVEQTPERPATEAVAPVVVTGPSPEVLFERLELAATEIASATPLQRELESIYSDAQSALRFLAMNFLPTRRVDEGSAAEESSTSETSQT